ncbi:glycosyltransferase family 2 protein [Microbulbifer variabilis]|uniref:Glycosyltransferase family 2 protein n=1 Tax=Microbulbifer variabilis TaxID=266805 RepID=A0ABY4V6V0_9GAMM|nr:glycosyltransferase [Microbulbifer variabilis]USD19640.1 glycosyltransferase family 2 protein [Microbulbifer variabilis]
MWEEIQDGYYYLISQSYTTLFLMLWVVVIFEIPRYLFSFFTALVFFTSKPEFEPDIKSLGKVSVIIAGHNEEESIEQCVLSLWEQSRPPDEIIVVNDGSTDGMRQKACALLKQGLIHGVHSTELRGGKSSALNLGLRFTTGDIILNVDCDCSFDYNAIKRMLEQFDNPMVGAASSNIFVRNWDTNLLTTFQAIEYMIAISLGKHALTMLEQMSCASGAFSGFRREALIQAGGFDSGGGEDLDVTLRIRHYGWKVEYAAESICYTDVPTNLGALIRQRFRWERDAVRLRFRKYRHFINPFEQRLKFREFFHQFEFLLFNVIAILVLPFYLAWLFYHYGVNGWFILIGAQIVLIILDIITFTLSALAVKKFKPAPLWPYLLGYSIFYVNLMRIVRLYSYIQEWVFKSSYYDTYAPSKVHRVRE